MSKSVFFDCFPTTVLCDSVTGESDCARWERRAHCRSIERAHGCRFCVSRRSLPRSCLGSDADCGRTEQHGADSGDSSLDTTSRSGVPVACLAGVGTWSGGVLWSFKWCLSDPHHSFDLDSMAAKLWFDLFLFFRRRGVRLLNVVCTRGCRFVQCVGAAASVRPPSHTHITWRILSETKAPLKLYTKKVVDGGTKCKYEQ